MFGVHAKHQSAEEREIAVDRTLEQDICAVEQSIEAYLQSPSNSLRNDLLAVLDRLDDQIDLGDAYNNNIVGSGAFGYSTKFAVLGETSNNPMAEEVPNMEFQAQVALVKAAKKQVTEPTAATLASLRTASAALSAMRAGEEAAPPPQA